ncbi:helix-turn-helix domain-containing protein [Lactovum odontotermitis]
MHVTPDWLKKIPNLPEFNDNIKFFGGHKQTVPYKWVNDWEYHFAFELLVILKGTQRTDLPCNITYELTEEDIILIPAGLQHKNSCTSSEGLSYFCIHFNIDDLELQQRLLTDCPIVLDRSSAAYKKVSSILIEYIKILEGNVFDLIEKMTIEKLLFELVISLLGYVDKLSGEIDYKNSEEVLTARLIAETIRANFYHFITIAGKENRYLISLGYIAKQLYISESKMLKIFKKVYLMNPKKYLDKIRCDESRFLLCQPQLTIQKISEIIGYDNVSHFSRQFKSWCGLTPSEYRRYKAHL